MCYYFVSVHVAHLAMWLTTLEIEANESIRNSFTSSNFYYKWPKLLQISPTNPTKLINTCFPTLAA